jgi:hypothetical protein
MRATCPVYLILVDLITPITFGEVMKLGLTRMGELTYAHKFLVVISEGKKEG